MDITNIKLNTIMHSKRENMFYFEHCHSMQKDEQVVFLTKSGKKNTYYNIPITTTDKEIPASSASWESMQYYLIILSLAALFHDCGKITDAFQRQLQQHDIKDKYRHEWISVKILEAIIANYNSDKDWLTVLQQLSYDESKVIQYVINNQDKPINIKILLDKPIALTILLLILSHHRKPTIQKDIIKNNYANTAINNPTDVLKNCNFFSPNFGYIRENVTTPLAFSQGIFPQSYEWNKMIIEYATKAIDNIDILNKIVTTEQRDFLLYIGTLALRIGDYNASNQNHEDKYTSNIYAKSHKVDIKYAQRLDEHLLKMQLETNNAFRTIFNVKNSVGYVYDGLQKLRQPRTTGKFKWQSIAVTNINKAFRDNKDKHVFAVLTAGTGCGKTRGIAEIMYAIRQHKYLRYAIVQGRRSLTLQTRTQYENDIGINKSNMAALVGDNNIRKLYTALHDHSEEENDNHISVEPIFDYSDINVVDEKLKVICNNEQNKILLYTPILISTIDYIIGACESTKGQNSLVPLLRLLTSDIAIDEIDELALSDNYALCRLAYTIGLCGNNLLIASATLREEQVKNMYNAWQTGINTYEMCFNTGKENLYIFTNEFETIVTKKFDDYNKFVDNHIKSISTYQKHKGMIIDFDKITYDWNNTENEYYAKMIAAGVSMHYNYNTHFLDKDISFGIIRFANTTPCVRCCRCILENDIDDNIDIYVLPFHSRNLMIHNSYQEQYMSKVLNRKENYWQEDNTIINKIKQSTKKNIMFVIVATTKIEIGCDYDVDWAVTEFSTLNSLVQLSGRVGRHRNFIAEQPNIAIMDYNIRSLRLKNDTKIAFKFPGYESNIKIGKDPKHRSKALKLILNTHRISNLLDNTFLDSINSARLIKANTILKPTELVEDLEHKAFQLLNDKYTLSNIDGYINSIFKHTDLQQVLFPFRNGLDNVDLYYSYQCHSLNNDLTNSSFDFKMVDDNTLLESYHPIHKIDMKDINVHKLWWHYSVLDLLRLYCKTNDVASLEEQSHNLCTLSIPDNFINSKKEHNLKWNEALGFWDETNWMDYDDIDCDNTK